jgi:hypothetical protein
MPISIFRPPVANPQYSQGFLDWQTQNANAQANPGTLEAMRFNQLGGNTNANIAPDDAQAQLRKQAMDMLLNRSNSSLGVSNDVENIDPAVRAAALEKAGIATGAGGDPGVTGAFQSAIAGALSRGEQLPPAVLADIAAQQQNRSIGSSVFGGLAGARGSNRASAALQAGKGAAQGSRELAMKLADAQSQERLAAIKSAQEQRQQALEFGAQGMARDLQDRKFSADMGQSVMDRELSRLENARKDKLQREALLNKQMLGVFGIESEAANNLLRANQQDALRAKQQRDTEVGAAIGAGGQLLGGFIGGGR